MCPSLLKTQLTAQVDKTEGLLAERDLLYANEIVMILNLVLDLFPGFVDSINERGSVVDDLKFPIGGEVVGGFEQPLLKA
jgi:hypothetical protein